MKSVCAVSVWGVIVLTLALPLFLPLFRVADVRSFGDCMAGPGLLIDVVPRVGPYPCLAFDYDHDHDVDLRDFAEFERRLPR